MIVESSQQVTTWSAFMMSKEVYFLMFPVAMGLNAAPSPLAISAHIELADLILHSRERTLNILS